MACDGLFRKFAELQTRPCSGKNAGPIPEMKPSKRRQGPSQALASTASIKSRAVAPRVSELPANREPHPKPAACNS
jgi:hypothetical protein